MCTFVVLSYDPLQIPPTTFGGGGTSSHQLVDPEERFLPGPNPFSASLCLPQLTFPALLSISHFSYATHVPFCSRMTLLKWHKLLPVGCPGECFLIPTPSPPFSLQLGFAFLSSGFLLFFPSPPSYRVVFLTGPP